MKRIYLISAILALCTCAYSQGSISPEVYGAAGESSSLVNGVQVHWTIGEPLVETLATGNNKITQGFHQDDPFYSVNIEAEREHLSFLRAFPNPAREEVFLKIERSSVRPLYAFLIDMNGRVLRKDRSILRQDKLTFDLRGLPAGIYILRVTDQSGTSIQNFKINKFN